MTLSPHPVSGTSAFDNFEWAEGYGPKFGLIAIDRDKNLTRTPEPSAYAFARVATTGLLGALRDTPTSSDRHA